MYWATILCYLEFKVKQIARKLSLTGILTRDYGHQFYRAIDGTLRINTCLWIKKTINPNNKVLTRNTYHMLKEDADENITYGTKN